MEGAFESMSEGTVDYNWAKEHHPLWVNEEGVGRPQGTTRDGRPIVTPAE
jgi:formate dehydrogenase subunit gamma